MKVWARSVGTAPLADAPVSESTGEAETDVVAVLQGCRSHPHDGFERGDAVGLGVVEERPLEIGVEEVGLSQLGIGFTGAESRHGGSSREKR